MCRRFPHRKDSEKAAPDGAAFLLRLLQGVDLLGVALEEFVVKIKLLLHLVHQVRIGEGLDRKSVV